ncbi:MAG TPA: ECF transporter S component [Candidatus Limnocylindria bacterium]|nr:ECF transporter S component [Candidatus Limnocylindria bacterium]
MDGRWLRVGAALATFAVVAIVAVLLIGGIPEAGEDDPITGAFQQVADVLALILAVALLAAIAVYLGVERAQTGRIDSVAGQFTTRTIVLIPVAIALNIILGATVANALKIPIYLDSIGTILVGVLAGPLAGAATGFLANVLWSYVIPPPFQYPPAAAFAIVAAVIGLLAGTYARLGLLRPRAGRPGGQLLLAGAVTAAAVIGLAWLAFLGYRAFLASIQAGDVSVTPASDNPLFSVLGWLALLLVVATVLGLFALLALRRDVTVAYVVVCGLLTGIVAGLISAPISAGVFSGVTGAGTDFLVAAFREAGTTIYLAALGQSLISDPIDKIATFFLVYLVVSAMARRMKARFPQGERLIERDRAADDGLREAYA